MKIAIIGAGISGLLTARLLSEEHEIEVFEAESYAGGHTNTVSVDVFGKQYAVDTGFMVFNDHTYPNFIRMLEHLRVSSRLSDMSFGLRCDRTGLEYQGGSLSGYSVSGEIYFVPASIACFERFSVSIGSRFAWSKAGFWIRI